MTAPPEIPNVPVLDPVSVSSPAKRQTDVRGHNLALVLQEVHLRGEISRAELTAISGLNRSTIAGLVADLQEMGLVRERRPGGGAKAGRPSHLVTARDDGPLTVAIDLDVERLVVALVGLDGAVVDRSAVALPRGVAVTAVLKTIDHTLARLMAAAEQGSPLSGVGVSVPGTVRRLDGLVHSAPNLGWVDVPLAQLLTSRLHRRYPGLGVRVGNDADLGARAERLRGAARGIDDVVFLSGHVGVGGGIIVGGIPLAGARGFGGELGHMVVQLDGPDCRCGGRGCLEALIGSTALCAVAGPDYEIGVDGPGRVIADARKGRRGAVVAVETVATRLGIGLGSIVNVFDPQMIVVGGVLEHVLELGGRQVDAAMRRQLSAAARAGVTVCKPDLGQDSSLIGAAELAFDELLDTTLDPRWLGSSGTRR